MRRIDNRAIVLALLFSTSSVMAQEVCQESPEKLAAEATVQAINYQVAADTLQDIADALVAGVSKDQVIAFTQKAADDQRMFAKRASGRAETLFPWLRNVPAAPSAHMPPPWHSDTQ